MSLYDELFMIAKDYFGFANALFVSRVLNEIGKNKSTLTVADVPAFAEKIPELCQTALSSEKIAELQERVLSLKSFTE